MAGRPPRIRTLEEIEAKLEPCALAFLYQPEEKARAGFLSSTRAKILGKAPILFDIESGIPKKEYTETILEICLNGQDAPAFRELPEEIQAELLKIEAQETPLQFKLRRAIKFTQEPPEEKKLLESTKIYINNIYNSTKYINCFYKWVLTEPQNGAPNFYSCFTSPEYSPELQRILKNQFIQNCDFVVISNIEAIPTSKSTIFLFIKKCLLKTINTILDLTAKCENNSERWPFQQDIETINKNLDIIEEIEKALEAVTLEDVTKRPSTRKEKKNSFFTGENVLRGAGHIPLVEEFSKLGERDAVKCMLSGVKHYENNHSDMMLDMVKSKYLTGKEILKDVLTDKIIRTTFHIGTQLEGREFFKTGIIKISKDEFMRFMGIEDAKIPDETTRRNFTKDTTEQLEMLLNCTFFMRKGGGGGAGCHILDAYSTKSQEFYIRLGKEFVETVTRYGKIAWTPTSLQANRIPNRNKVEYFLQIKLENDFTSIYTQANERDTLKVNTLLNYLHEYGAIDTENRKYKEKVIDRFIGALDYLQNVHKSIEYYFTTAPDKDAPAIEGPELEKYKTKANFSKLYLWYTIPELERYRNEEDAKNRIAEKKERALASQARRERARDNKLGELEAERIDKAREKAEAEAQAKAQSDQSQGKTLDEYFKGNH